MSTGLKYALAGAAAGLGEGLVARAEQAREASRLRIQQAFAVEQANQERAYRSEESEKDRSFRSSESEMDREFRSSESQAARNFQASQNAMSRAAQAARSARSGGGGSGRGKGSTVRLNDGTMGIRYGEEVVQVKGPDGEPLKYADKAQNTSQVYLENFRAIKESPDGFDMSVEEIARQAQAITDEYFRGRQGSGRAAPTQAEGDSSSGRNEPRSTGINPSAPDTEMPKGKSGLPLATSTAQVREWIERGLLKPGDEFETPDGNTRVIK